MEPKSSGTVQPTAAALQKLQDENRRLRERLKEVTGERDSSVMRAEERYRNVFEHSGDAIFCVTPTGIVMDWNDAAAGLFGFAAGEVIGRSFEVLWASGGRDRAGLLLEQLEHGETVAGLETWFERKDGSRRRVSLTCAPVIDVDGTVVGGSAIVRDITETWAQQDRLTHRQEDLEALIKARTAELEEANERLLRQEEMRALFIASMSHELRTPLNSIIGFSDLLASGMSGPLSEEQKNQIEIINNAGQHLLAVINDIVDLSRIEAGRLTVSREEFDLGALIDEVAAMKAPKIDPNRVSLSVRTEPIVVESDKRRVKQIILNLLSNAVKYTSEGRIVVNALHREHYIYISVQDTGCGISQEDQKKLFQPFQRAGDKVKRPGTGLGLFLSRELAKILGGDLTVESTPDVGSRFTLILPGSV